MSTPTRDRYVTFAGLDCDRIASAVVDRIRHHIEHTPAAGQWADYFSAKFMEQKHLVCCCTLGETFSAPLAG